LTNKSESNYLEFKS